MSRTDNDSWDITEGVGATALSVARARAVETDADCPLYTDPYAHFFVEAAIEAGWRSPFQDDHPVRAQAMAAYTRPGRNSSTTSSPRPAPTAWIRR